MRLIAKLTDGVQVGFLIDSLEKAGFDRKDMIVSTDTEDKKWHSADAAAEEVAFIKTEREGLWEIGSFANGVRGLKDNEGVLVAVEAPKHAATRVREMMEQAGALEIVQD